MPSTGRDRCVLRPRVLSTAGRAPPAAREAQVPVPVLTPRLEWAFDPAGSLHRSKSLSRTGLSSQGVAFEFLESSIMGPDVGYLPAH